MKLFTKYLSKYEFNSYNFKFYTDKINEVDDSEKSIYYLT